MNSLRICLSKSTSVTFFSSLNCNVFSNQVRLYHIGKSLYKRNLLLLSPQISKTGDENQRHSHFFKPYPNTTWGKIVAYCRKKVDSINYFRRQQERFSGLYLYESVEHLDYPLFFSYLQLPDTFHSWFAITELHIWMLLVRLMEEGPESRIVRDSVIHSFYEDSHNRAKALAPHDSIVKEQLLDMYEQIKTAMCVYDEGFLSSDTEFASALWYKFFSSHCDDPRRLEVLISYVRHQINHLHHISTKDVIHYKKAKVIWTPFQPHIDEIHKRPF